ncbi:MAG TPA: hypothetical protein VN238_04160 [Solirubrobacteraceae bacterium]|nr:hypothetical protein [Solirubrobacteraceae bacterium]
MSGAFGKMTPVDFDTVLAILHGWLGEPVEVVVEVTVRPYAVARMSGLLAPAPGIATPEDDDQFEFRVEPGSGFALRRDHFHDADLFPAVGRLLVALVDDAAEIGERGEHVSARLELIGPPVGGVPGVGGGGRG